MRSMTGFGRGEASGAGFGFRAEVATVNRKQADFVIAMPRELAELEPRVRERLAGMVSRGRVNLTIAVTPDAGASAQEVRVDEALAAGYFAALRRLGEKLGIAEMERALDPLRAPGVVSLAESLPDPEQAWPPLRDALTAALEQMVAMREAEGAHLLDDLQARIGRLRELVAAISERAPGVAARYRELLFKRLAAAGLELDLDDERVQREIGLFADRCDISEELTRLESHFAQCERYFAGSDAAGRPLDFLAQEMNRELNTIGSKANDAEIAQRVVEAKTELEKLREQVQNVE